LNKIKNSISPKGKSFLIVFFGTDLVVMEVVVVVVVDVAAIGVVAIGVVAIGISDGSSDADDDNVVGDTSAEDNDGNASEDGTDTSLLLIQILCLLNTFMVPYDFLDEP